MYAPTTIRMLDAGIDANDLAKHLKWIVTERMELSSDDKKNLVIASELVDFWEKWKGGQGSGLHSRVKSDARSCRRNDRTEHPEFPAEVRER